MKPNFLSAAEIEGRYLVNGRSILGVIGFGADRPSGLAEDVPFARAELPLILQGHDYEVWSSNDTISFGCAHGIAFAMSNLVLFGIVQLRADRDADIEATALNAYTSIFALCSATGHPHLIRVFNYISAISEEENGVERYRRFNAGRSAAFSACGQSMSDSPAACALGMASGGTVIYFIACRDRGHAIENPRQISAYCYPVQYGMKSPSFSRAMRIGSSLYISGTASIVGHKSLHLGDPIAQTEEILRNFDALLQEAAGCSVRDVSSTLSLKVYLRNAQDLLSTQMVLSSLQPAGGMMTLRADICRADLLVEIEGFCCLPRR